MNKVVADLVALGVLVVAIVGYLMMMKKPPTSPTASIGASPETNVFSSIKNALSKSISLKCEYPNPDGQGSVVSYIKNGAVRVGSLKTTDAGYGAAIMKDNKMWIWDDTKKEGMIVDLTEGATNQVDQKTQALEDLEKYKSYCKPEIVADSMFTAPADVKFTDLKELMKGLPSNPTGN